MTLLYLEIFLNPVDFAAERVDDAFTMFQHKWLGIFYRRHALHFLQTVNITGEHHCTGLDSHRDLYQVATQWHLRSAARHQHLWSAGICCRWSDDVQRLPVMPDPAVSTTTFGQSLKTSLLCLSARLAHTRFGDRAFGASGPSVWNSLPAELRQSDLSLSGTVPPNAENFCSNRFCSA